MNQLIDQPRTVRRTLKKKSLVAALIARGMLLSILVTHLYILVYFICVPDQFRIGEYVFFLIIFVLFFFLPATAIYSVNELIFRLWKKKWNPAGYAAFKILASALITGIVVCSITTYCVPMEDFQTLKGCKELLFKDGLWFFIAYAPIAFFVDYLLVLIKPDLKF